MQRFLYTKKRDIKMQWKYVVLQYRVLGPGLALRVQSLVLALALSLKSLLTSLPAISLCPENWATLLQRLQR